MFKLVFKYSLYYKKEFFISLISIIIESILELSCPFFMNLLLKNGLNENIELTYSLNLNYVITLSIIMIVFTVLAFIFGYIFAKSVAKYSKLVAYKIREEEYKKIYNSSLNTLSKFSYSSLLTRLTNDIEIFSHTLSTSFRPLFRSPIMLIGIITISLFTSIELSLVFIIALPLEALIMFYIIKKAKSKFIKIQEELDKINEVNKESITSIKTIKSFVKENYEETHFDKINKESKRVQNEAYSLNAIIHPIQDLIQYFLVIIILDIGYNLYLSREYSHIVINISMFLNYLTQTLATISMISNVALEVNKAQASSSRINEILSLKEEIDINNDLKINIGKVEFKNVSFSYNNSLNKLVLKNISFILNKGDKLGILGETSSGKTTILNLFSRLYTPTLGEILIDDININKYSNTIINQNIAIVFQHSFFFNDTILNNLKWGNEYITQEEIISILKLTCSYDFVFNLKDNLNFIVSEGGTNLSAGEKQRLSLARALIKKPKILILDDAFSHLDKNIEEKIKTNLFNDKELTILNISSKASSFLNMNKIIILNDGIIIDSGTKEELNIKSKLFKEITELESFKIN